MRERHPNHRRSAIGAYLDNLILMHGMTRETFANYSHISLSQLSRIIYGTGHITALIAVRLSAALSTDAHFWLAAQAQIDLKKIEMKIASRKVKLAKPLPPPRKQT